MISHDVARRFADGVRFGWAQVRVRLFLAALLLAVPSMHASAQGRGDGPGSAAERADKCDEARRTGQYRDGCGMQKPADYRPPPAPPRRSGLAARCFLNFLLCQAQVAAESLDDVARRLGVRVGCVPFAISIDFPQQVAVVRTLRAQGAISSCADCKKIANWGAEYITALAGLAPVDRAVLRAASALPWRCACEKVFP